MSVNRGVIDLSAFRIDESRPTSPAAKGVDAARERFEQKAREARRDLLANQIKEEPS